jgi:hypothetical protein
MKSPKPSSLDLQNLHYEISNLFTIKSPIPLQFDFQSLHCDCEISSVFTLKSPMPSPFDVQTLHYEISSLLTAKSPMLSPLRLQSLHYKISKFFTTQSPVPILSSDTPISAARATPGSQNWPSRTVNTQGYELNVRQQHRAVTKRMLA